ncbi:hypothetical protein BC826DRAFT_991125, partial [Russula brevipes]
MPPPDLSRLDDNGKRHDIKIRPSSFLLLAAFLLCTFFPPAALSEKEDTYFFFHSTSRTFTIHTSIPPVFIL